MPRLAHTYPLAKNRCGHCNQGFPTQMRRHISHSPRCQAAVLQKLALRDTAEGEPGHASSIQGVKTYTDDVDPDADLEPEFFASHEEDLDDHHKSVHLELEHEGDLVHDNNDHEACRRFAHKFDEGQAGDVLGSAKTAFESMKDLQDTSGQCAYALFADHDEWELADWLVNNVNQGATDKFLKLGIMSHINPCGNQHLRLL
ncbi:hypothetical protein JVT61DRAFT_13618 [Boletus reticuloceps]|uniref:Uncharacterized protein n=1 Tax=Boletus reticuloceps TaxID=495285 RepID=A0A8I2YD77_9AGAM|nr:hypothetical protein JVT61DRAFT_13618 [Boletus reticuloceps]